MISVVRMSGFATIQDLGRRGHGAEAVPLSGAMDANSLALANELVGNPRGAAAIEWGLAGGAMQFDAPAVIAVTGARAEVTHNGVSLPLDAPVKIAAGDAVGVERLPGGAYIYVAVRGGVEVPTVLGSRSTYLPGGFGGLEGRRLRTGDSLRTGAQEIAVPSPPRAPGVAATREPRGPIRVIEGPDTALFTREFRESFWAADFTISRQSNRAGYRLERPSAADPGQRSLPSSPACVGAIQVPDGSSAIVLMPDGPTVGGYPKIGVVASVDIGALAQRTPGDRVRFERVSPADARRLLRDARR